MVTVHQRKKQEVHDALQIPKEALGEILGLPTAVGKVSYGTFDYVPDRIRNFIHGWGGKLLSYAGREVLMNANAPAVPTYPMSCFKLTAPACKKMKHYMSNYWWGSSIDNHKIYWQHWSKLTRTKEDGGMGFRDLPLFNQAMLGKQGWRLLMRPESLCAHVLKGKYFPPLIRRQDARVNLVSDLFIPGSRRRNTQLINECFFHVDAAEILKLKPGLRLNETSLLGCMRNMVSILYAHATGC